MQKRAIKILIACGSGVATSTLAAATVQELCDAAQIEAKLQKSSMMEMPFIAPNVDLVLTTNKFSGDLPCPLLSITAFVTGIKEKQKKEELTQILQEIAAQL